MAKIILRIDTQTTGEDNVTDAKFLSQIDLAVTAWNGPISGTTNEKLTFVASRLRGYLLEVAKGEKRRQRQDAMEAQLVQEAADLSG